MLCEMEKDAYMHKSHELDMGNPIELNEFFWRIDGKHSTHMIGI
jgi:hypothetical protein